MNFLNHPQILNVQTENWESFNGVMTLYEMGERIDAFPVVVGRLGLTLNKAEGDRRSPAGIFPIGGAFGHVRPLDLKVDFIATTEGLEAVDDPSSKFYNHIVDRNKVVCDWKSSEKLIEYECGIVVNYNFPKVVPHKGSAIFLHEWKGSGVGTAGCTAMSKENFYKILKWLDSEKQPVLVQFPICYNGDFGGFA